MTVLAFITKIIFGILYILLASALPFLDVSDTSYQDEMTSELSRDPWLTAVILIFLFAAFETLISQWLVIGIIKKFTRNIFVTIFISAIIFSAIHVEPMLMVAVFPIGIILAWSFILMHRKSLWTALWVTTIIHTLHNLLVIALITGGVI